MKIRAALILFVFAVIIYSNSLGGGFVYDDEYFVVKNVAIRSLENLPSFFTDPSAIAFSELSQDVWRPLTTLSYALNYAVGKFNTFDYHLVNVLVHGLNAVLVFILLSLVFGETVPAFLAAALFACHPVQTEVVAWISGRSSVLFLFFYLAAFLAYLQSTRNTKRGLFAASLALYAAALLSKEMAVTLPLVIIAYDLHFAPPERLGKRLARYAPYFILTAGFVLARSMVLQRVSQCGWWGGSPYHTYLTMSHIIIEYLKLLIAPARLCAFYVTNVHTSIADTPVILSLAVLAMLIASLPYLFKHARIVSFGVWWFFLTLLPVSNIVPLRALMAERFLYLPSIGFCMIVALAIARFAVSGPGAQARARRFAAAAAALALVVSYSVRTIVRNEDWRDAETISASILKVTPLNPWAFASLGASYADQERHTEAIKPLLKAIVLSESYFAPRNILGFCYLELGQYEKAIRVLEGALAVKPDNLEALNSLGVAYASVGRYDDAVRQFERSIRVDPTFVSGYINLGTAYDKMGRYDKALESFGRVEKNVRSRQDRAIALLRMGDVYVRMKDIGRAREYYRKALDLCGRGMEQLREVASRRLTAVWDVK